MSGVVIALSTGDLRAISGYVNFGVDFRNFLLKLNNYIRGGFSRIDYDTFTPNEIRLNNHIKDCLNDIGYVIREFVEVKLIRLDSYGTELTFREPSEGIGYIDERELGC